MIRFQRRFITKVVAVFLVLLFINVDAWLSPQSPENPESQGNPSEKTFRGAARDYQKGKYWDVVQTLEVLLVSIEEEAPADDRQSETFKGKVFLLLGAACEQSGQLKKAEEYYQSAKALLSPFDLKIEGLDFGKLKEFQRIIKGRTITVAGKKGVIERPVYRRKRKRISKLLLVQMVIVVGGVAAFLLIKKKEKPFIDTEYDKVKLGIRYEYVSPGESRMGDNFNEGQGDERPVHAVYLDGFYISNKEITFGQYDMFCEATNREKPGDNGWGRGPRPVIDVTWADANAFCEWLSQKTTKDIKLPTEAQWEKAARGTDQRRYPWGNYDPTCDIVNYGCYSYTVPVGTISARSTDVHYCHDLYDMAGNVSEWCIDRYDPNYYQSSPYNNPVNTAPADSVTTVDHVIRGGGWNNTREPGIRSADRHYAGGGTRANDIGFRIVLKQ